MRTIVLALLALGATGCAGVRLWDGYLGAGGMAGTIRWSHPSIDGQGETGAQVLLGYDLTENLTWDIRGGGLWIDVAPPPEITYPADSGDFALLATGLLVRLGRREDEARPFLIYGAGAAGSVLLVTLDALYLTGR
jgi:hypothetical protein